MPQVKPKGSRARIYSDKRARKKHVESMFLTNKQKQYTYYFKDRNLRSRFENKRANCMLKRYFFSLKMLQSGYITIAPLKAIVRLYKWFLKTRGIERGLKLRLRVFPDFVLTSKPKEMRMGKGKGAPNSKVALIRAGAILFTLENRGISDYLTRQLALMLSRKVPLDHKLVSNQW